MKRLIILIISVLLIIYHIKNTDYSLTVYLVQALGAVILAKIYFKYKDRKKVREYD